MMGNLPTPFSRKTNGRQVERVEITIETNEWEDVVNYLS